MVYLSGVVVKRDTSSVRPLKIISDSPEPVVEDDSDITSEGSMMEADEPVKCTIAPLRQSQENYSNQQKRLSVLRSQISENSANRDSGNPLRSPTRTLLGSGSLEDPLPKKEEKEELTMSKISMNENPLDMSEMSVRNLAAPDTQGGKARKMSNVEQFSQEIDPKT